MGEGKTVINSEKELLSELRKYKEYSTVSRVIVDSDKSSAVCITTVCNKITYNAERGVIRFTSKQGSEINFNRKIDHSEKIDNGEFIQFFIYFISIPEPICILVA